MNIVFGIIIGLIILMLLVIAHEFGHFIMARRSGVKVNEFGIGFPPRAAAWVKRPVQVKDKNGDTIEKQKWVRIPKSDWEKPQDSLVFSLNYLPIGGFCAMDGESDADTRKGTFGATSFWNKTKILFGGVLMNWLIAAILLTVLALTGMPQFLPNQFKIDSDATAVDVARFARVAEVMEGSPAAQAGFQPSDEIIAVNGESVASAPEVISIGDAHAGETVTYKIRRDDAEQELSVKLNDHDAPYVLGVSIESYGQTLVRSTWSAPIVGIGTTLQLTGETFRSLGDLVWNVVSGVVRQFSFNEEVREVGRNELADAGDSVSGPVGIVGVIFPQFVSAGATNLAFLAALISVSLACMNVLPIPALDGGRWLLIAIYKLRHKKLTKETEEKIVSRAFAVLLGLIVIITVLDVMKLF